MASTPLDPNRLEALRGALERHDLAAIDYYEDLAPALTAAWGAAATQALGQAIADLKFGAALADLQALASPTSPRTQPTTSPAPRATPPGPTGRARNQALSPDTP